MSQNPADQNPDNVVPLAPLDAAGVESDPAARIAQLEAEAAALKDQALRAMAEVDNTRKRAAKEREDAMKYGTTALAKELLTVSDNLRRALEASASLGPDAKNFIEGVEATERQLLAAFERAGIKRVEPLGQVFDPNFHQVMMEIENTGKPAGTIVQVLQAGYVIHDRLLREALVGVAKGAAGVDGTAGQNVNVTG